MATAIGVLGFMSLLAVPAGASAANDLPPTFESRICNLFVDQKLEKSRDTQWQNRVLECSSSSCLLSLIDETESGMPEFKARYFEKLEEAMSRLVGSAESEIRSFELWNVGLKNFKVVREAGLEQIQNLEQELQTKKQDLDHCAKKRGVSEVSRIKAVIAAHKKQYPSPNFFRRLDLEQEQDKLADLLSKEPVQIELAEYEKIESEISRIKKQIEDIRERKVRGLSGNDLYLYRGMGGDPTYKEPRDIPKEYVSIVALPPNPNEGVLKYLGRVIDQSALDAQEIKYLTNWTLENVPYDVLFAELKVTAPKEFQQIEALSLEIKEMRKSKEKSAETSALNSQLYRLGENYKVLEKKLTDIENEQARAKVLASKVQKPAGDPVVVALVGGILGGLIFEGIRYVVLNWR